MMFCHRAGGIRQGARSVAANAVLLNSTREPDAWAVLGTMV